MRLLMVSAVLVIGCTRTNPDYCDQDSDCDPAKPFCDIKGEYAESGHVTHTCTVKPVGCPVERCGCTPGLALTCTSDQLTVCAESGHDIATVACPLGCASGEVRCLTFDPSNGLAIALAQAAMQPELAVHAGTRLDTELGLAQDSSGAT